MNVNHELLLNIRFYVYNIRKHLSLEKEKRDGKNTKA